MTEQGNGIWRELETVMSSGKSNIFNDWLDLAVLDFLSVTKMLVDGNLNKKNYSDKYLIKFNEIAEQYDKKELKTLINAYLLLFRRTEATQTDIIGEIYQEKITMGEHGQFFTPNPIIDFMVKMVNPVENKNVCDPACGSGRFLVKSGLNNPDVFLTGCDIDQRCAKMATLNMFMLDFNADIYWGCALGGGIHRKYMTRKGGWLFETEKNMPKLMADLKIEDDEQGKLF